MCDVESECLILKKIGKTKNKSFCATIPQNIRLKCFVSDEINLLFYTEVGILFCISRKS